jgi:predicted O-methyltransferase YrrM
MLHYKDIEGWFSKSDSAFYMMVANNLPETARILEVGSYKGRSTVCMDSHCKYLEKNVTIDVIDIFTGDNFSMGVMPSYLDEFKSNTAHCNIGNVIVEDSATAHRHLQHKYDFIFIDAQHDFDSVVADITNYLPHVKQGGAIGGHDLQFFDIAKALAHLKMDYYAFENCWLFPCPP